MLEKYHIVGCGTIGSNLALALSTFSEVEKIFLYDVDVVGREHINPVFPFNENCRGLFKTRVVEDVLRLTNPSLEVEACQTVVTSEKFTDGFIIDCRDKKNRDLHSDVRLSLDNHVLVLDSIQDCQAEIDFHHYSTTQEYRYVHLAISIILSYLSLEMYKKHNKIMYLLDEVIVDYQIISKENEEGV